MCIRDRSFVDEEQVWTVVEGLMKEIFRNLKNVELDAFPRLTYNECMARYGSDKPDTRFGMEDVYKRQLFDGGVKRG